MNIFKCKEGTSLAVQWLRLRASTAGSMSLIPGQGTKIPRATLCSQEKKFKCKELDELFCEYPRAHHPDPTTTDIPFSLPTFPLSIHRCS